MISNCAMAASINMRRLFKVADIVVSLTLAQQAIGLGSYSLAGFGFT